LNKHSSHFSKVSKLINTNLKPNDQGELFHLFFINSGYYLLFPLKKEKSALSQRKGVLSGG